MENKIKILETFRNSLDEYHKYQLNWLADHGYSIYDILEIANDYEKELEETGKDGGDVTFNEYIQEHGFKNGEVFVCYNEWLNNEYNNELMKLIKEVSVNDVLDTMSDLKETGIMDKESYDRILKKYKEDQNE